jgi:hypothetical protein
MIEEKIDDYLNETKKDKTKKKIRLLIDDERFIDCDIVARTAKEGKKYLALHKGNIIELYLDGILSEKPNDETGAHVLVWAFENDLVPPYVRLISDSPAMLKFMNTLLLSNGFKRISEREYRKK